MKTDSRQLYSRWHELQDQRATSATATIFTGQTLQQLLASAHSMKTPRYTLSGIARSPLIFGGNLPSNADFTLSPMANDDALEPYRHAKQDQEFAARAVWEEGSSCRNSVFHFHA